MFSLKARFITFHSIANHLHVFPTRRSSDLGNAISISAPPTSGEPGKCVCPPRRGRSVRDRDRKSTRLNSSHDCNSYAVFYLKKKKAYGLGQNQTAYCRFSQKARANAVHSIA